MPNGLPNPAATDPLSMALVRLADGDRSAFEDVYAAVAPRVDALCVRVLGAGPDAEDAAQQALLKILVRCDDYDPRRGPAMPWAMGVAIWEARSVGRKRFRRREDPLPQTPIRDDTPDPEATAVHADLLRLIEDGISHLRPLDRATLLASLEHRPPPIARATFRKRVQRAIRRLRSSLWSSHETR